MTEKTPVEKQVDALHAVAATQRMELAVARTMVDEAKKWDSLLEMSFRSLSKISSADERVETAVRSADKLLQACKNKRRKLGLPTNSAEIRCLFRKAEKAETESLKEALVENLEKSSWGEAKK